MKRLIIMFAVILGFTASAQEKTVNISEELKKEFGISVEGFQVKYDGYSGVRFEKGASYVFVYLAKNGIERVATNDNTISRLEGYEINERKVIWNSKDLVYIDKDRFGKDRYIFYPKKKLTEI